MAHENQFLRVEKGYIVSEDNQLKVKEIALVIDDGTGVVHKIGNAEEDIVYDYYLQMYNALADKGYRDEANELSYVELKDDGVLTIDSICSLVNYMRNSIGRENMREILTKLNENDVEYITQLIDKITGYGF